LLKLALGGYIEQ